MTKVTGHRFIVIVLLTCFTLVASFQLFANQKENEAQTTSKDNVAKSSVTIDAEKFPTLQAAIDALPKTGGCIQLAPKKYEIAEPLVLNIGEVKIVGAGTATQIVNTNKSGQPAFHIHHPNFAKKKTRMWRVQFSDLRISGTKESGDGILAEGVNEIYFTGVTIDHHGRHGINLVDCYEDPRIVGCMLLYNAKAGLEVNACHDIVVSANHFEENEDAVHCTNSYNLCMSGNNLDDHLRHGVVIENTYGSIVSSNMIEECQGSGIVLDRNCYGITLSANVIAHESGGGIQLLGAHGCAVSANTFTIVFKNSIYVGPKSGRLTITGNNFSNSYIGEKVKRTGTDIGTGILLDGTTDLVISGNSFTGLHTPAIKAENGCKRLLINGNGIVEVNMKSPSKDAKAIDLGDAKECVVQGNLE